jgi:predicted small metal-binding protein
MIRQVRCECGFTARAPTDDKVVALILDHLVVEHPELVGSETADDVKEWIELVPD